MEYLGRYLRFFDSVIREMLERGHTVHLVFEREQAAPKPLDAAWLRRMERHPNFRWSHTLAWRRDPWFRVARPVRGALDYVYFLQLGADRVPYLLRRARGRAPRPFQLVMRLPGMRSRPALRSGRASSTSAIGRSHSAGEFSSSSASTTRTSFSSRRT